MRVSRLRFEAQQQIPAIVRVVRGDIDFVVVSTPRMAGLIPTKENSQNRSVRLPSRIFALKRSWLLSSHDENARWILRRGMRSTDG